MTLASHSKIGPVEADTREAITRLTQAVLSVRPLIDALDHPVFVAPVTEGTQPEDEVALERLLNRIGGHCGAPEFSVLEAAARSDLTIFEKIVSDRLRDCGVYEAARQMSAESPEIDAIIGNVVQESFERKFNCTEISSFDGAVLKAYTAGG